VSLGEVLTWLYALREHHKPKLATDFRAASPGERTFHGLIFARNQVQHDLVSVAGLVKVSSLSPIRATSKPGIVGPVTDMRWKPRRKLKRTKRDKRLKRMYDRHVRGKPVIDPIDVAVTFILSVP
jgi:hypothetical protein